MVNLASTKQQFLEEIESLRARLEGAEAALEAIRSGEVDALVINTREGEQVFILQGAEHPYRVMVESMNEGAATVLEDGSILYANRRLSTILDEPLETLIGSSILEYIDPKDARLFEVAANTGFSQPSRVEILLRSSRDSEVPVLISFGSTQAQGAKALCLVVTDLTDQKRNEEILRAERLTRSILDQATEAILVCDLEGKIIRANRAALEIVPSNPLYQRYEDALQRVSKDSHPDSRGFSIARVLAGESFQDVEIEYLSSQGGNRYFLLNAAPLLNDDDTPAGGIVTLMDITERKNAEKEIRTYANRLRISNKELESFAFVASHDLQEPLRKIIAFGDLIGTESRLVEKEQDYLQRIQAAASRMQTMIDDLLALSRVTTHRKPFELVNLNPLVRTILDDLEARIRQSQGQIIVHPLPIIEADPIQIQRLFQNLLGNALKFHRPGIPPVVEIRYRDIPPDQIEVSVQDNGIGFDMKYLADVFQPFKRLHGRSEFEGSGMGLSICKKIVERHGGAITAESTPGQGTTFVIVLPVKQPVPAD